MRPKIKKLCLYFILFYLALHSPEDLARLLLGEPAFAWLGWGLPFTITAMTAFLLYALISYLLLFYGYKKLPAPLLVVLYLVVAIPVMISLRYLIQEVIGYAIIGQHNYSSNMLNVRYYVLDNISYALLYSSFGIVFYFAQLSKFTLLAQEQLRLKMQEAEIAFLRSQINPHFLFNSLNNIYSLVYQKREEALPVIARLSNLLRYMIYSAKDTVLLDEELHYLKDFIELQLIRYSPRPGVRISMPEEKTHYRVSPLLLIPLVENAFKHGDITHCATPLQIEAKLTGNEFHFSVSNLKGRTKLAGQTGVGLENIRRRMSLLYGDKGKLTIKENSETFSAHLKLPLYA